MKSWQEDLLSAMDDQVSEHEMFSKLEFAARDLGFEHCAYGMRLPLPMSKPRTIMLNNYPAAWQTRYEAAGYLATDPTVRHALRTPAPLVWSDAVFARTPELWSEARSFGLNVGWAQSSFNASGVGGMLTLSRSDEALTRQELADKEVKMSWLASMAHMAMSQALPCAQNHPPELTAREIEILKWTADGKTSGEISDLLTVSHNTVNFHVKNAVAKLQTANKTAAVVRAAMLGLLT